MLNLAAEIKVGIMKYLGLIVLFFAFSIANSQTIIEEPVKRGNGEIIVQGLDPLGAEVSVTYDQNKNKIYQERTLNGETTYVYFEEGVVTEYGTIVNPALVSTSVSSPHKSDEP